MTHEAMHRVGSDLLDVFDKHEGAADATQQRLIELGLDPLALATGEAGLVFGTIGSIVGGLVSQGISQEAVFEFVTNRASQGEHPENFATVTDYLAPRAAAQVRRWTRFSMVELDQICRPGTADQVLGHMIEMFASTAIALDLMKPPTDS